ncbi:maleylpyruvate isomerase family mycothiol-dependent enzyme [Gordonia polyisoprenivorans]|nr:maleylpyruvate isomerase family mycothiol-dependent enzyme [Gordonia polyisoprenivorans]UZF54529.1 maleylpyruvate isomerase family mycothiol-dependent enzyme [Gordonia polyisoprenivorans]
MSPTPAMSFEQWMAAITTHGAMIAATSTDDLGVPVPSCPEWTAADLISHVGAVHRWAKARIVGDDSVQSYADFPTPPAEELTDWYRGGLRGLVEALGTRDPDTAAPTFVGERTVGWWARRQAHELTVHRWDLESAIRPGTQKAVDAELSADGIEEWLEVFAPRFLSRSGGVPQHLHGATLHIHTHDEPVGEWLVELSADGLTWSREHMKADVALRGSAFDLLLTLWHRRPLSAVDTVGDAGVAAELLDLIHVT